MTLHPKLTPKSPNEPFKDGQDWSAEGEEALRQQRRESGNLSDSSDDEGAKVQNSTPYRNLRST